MDNQELKLIRQDRILKAMNGEKGDRTPLMWASELPLIQYSRPGTTYEQIVEDPYKYSKVVVEETMPHFPKVDMLSAVGMSFKNIGLMVMGKTYLPGRELKPNQMWQPVPCGAVRGEEDYKFIIENGWMKYNMMVTVDRLGYNPEDLMADVELTRKMEQLYVDAGYPFMPHFMAPSPFDTLAWGRGVDNFFIDMLDDPELIEETFDVILDEFEATEVAGLKVRAEELAEKGEYMFWQIVPCVNANCDMVSRETFDRFGWPMIERLSRLAMESKAKIFYHMDTNWTNVLDYWKDIPKGVALFDTDGWTDLNKVRDILGDRMAFTGTMDPAMLAFGEPDEIYKAAKEQMESMGDSFILAPSCGLPANTPPQNLEAMYAALE